MFTTFLTGDYSLVTYSLDQGADINVSDSHGISPIHAAAYANKFEMLGFLIARGANVEAITENDETPLFLAAKFGTYFTHFLPFGVFANSNPEK